jgi:hypothetical protein
LPFSLFSFILRTRCGRSSPELALKRHVLLAANFWLTSSTEHHKLANFSASFGQLLGGQLPDVMKKILNSIPRPIDEGLPINPPPGEDFFLATIEILSNLDPCWNEGFSIVGPWKTLSPTVSKFLAYDPRAKHSRISIFQGDQARNMLRFHLFEEARYQEQKRAQSSN